MEAYRRALAGGMSADAAQALAVDHMARIADELDRPRGWMVRLGLRERPPVRGLYLHGGVGRGKTWLMDLFVGTLPASSPHRRVHFHRYMQEVHRRLKVLGDARDPLAIVAAEQADRMRVLCFDEFHVDDIADAMLLAGLLRGLIEGGVTLIATSNLRPPELYRDGLQRARFLPTIDLLQEHCEVLEVDGGVDYRLRVLEQAEIYHHPLDEDAERNLEVYFRQLVVEHGREADALEVNGRPIATRRLGDGVVHFDFGPLCEGARSTEDYIEIAREFHTVLLAGVPVLGADSDDAARRFVHLVDEFYDRNVKLILSAAAPLAELYTGRRLAFEFQRTRSRLEEMQSRDYLAREHLP